MNIPHKCPICKGKGEIGKKLAQVSSVVVSTKPLRFKCHGCYGTGMVWEFSLQPFMHQIPHIQQIPPFDYPPTQWTVTGTADLAPKCDSCQTFIFGPPGEGCQNILSHVQAYNHPDWKLSGEVDGKLSGDPGKNGNNCACAPWGQPHSDNCKAAW